jgi:hypothetical protein
MDMSEAYELETRAHCPQAVIVYDLFHIVAKYGREVSDRVRLDLTNRLARAAGPNDLRTRARRRVIKGTRWLLLRNRENVNTPRDRVRLREVLAANRPLWVVYVLKDALKRLWRYRYRRAALRAWHQWSHLCQADPHRSRINRTASTLNSGLNARRLHPSPAFFDLLIAHLHPELNGVLRCPPNRVRSKKDDALKPERWPSCVPGGNGSLRFDHRLLNVSHASRSRVAV